MAVRQLQQLLLRIFDHFDLVIVDEGHYDRRSLKSFRRRGL
jgi:hypothetical protein